jgi:hypothetical protein
MSGISLAELCTLVQQQTIECWKPRLDTTGSWRHLTTYFNIISSFLFWCEDRFLWKSVDFRRFDNSHPSKIVDSGPQDLQGMFYAHWSDFNPLLYQVLLALNSFCVLLSTLYTRALHCVLIIVCACCMVYYHYTAQYTVGLCPPIYSRRPIESILLEHFNAIILQFRLLKNKINLIWFI